MCSIQWKSTIAMKNWRAGLCQLVLRRSDKLLEGAREAPNPTPTAWVTSLSSWNAAIVVRLSAIRTVRCQDSTASVLIEKWHDEPRDRGGVEESVVRRARHDRETARWSTGTIEPSVAFAAAEQTPEF